MAVRSLFLSAALAAASLAPILAVNASAADLAAGYRADAAVIVRAVPSQCGDPRILSRFQEHFNWADQNQWHSNLMITGFQGPRPQVGGYNNVSMIPHERCTADAMMTDGRIHRAYYVIEQGTGFASVGRGLDFCVDGLDPWRVHDGDCRTVR